MTGLQRSSSADFILSWSAPNHPRFIFGQSQLQALQNLRLPAPSSSGHRAAGLDREPTNVADLLASCWAPGPGAMLSTQMPEFLRLHRRVRSPSPRPPSSAVVSRGTRVPAPALQTQHGQDWRPLARSSRALSLSVSLNIMAVIFKISFKTLPLS